MVKPKVRRKTLARCDVCGSASARIRRMTRTYGAGKNLLVIENIPVVSCLACGERYMTARTLHEIERLKRHRARLAAGRKVGVVHFAA
jgi:YgiT-type zinc finger domain-containing protein